MRLCSNEEVMKLFWNMEPQEETTYKTRWNLNFPDFFLWEKVSKYLLEHNWQEINIVRKNILWKFIIV